MSAVCQKKRWPLVGLGLMKFPQLKTKRMEKRNLSQVFPYDWLLSLGIAALQLDYSVPFPLSLVISRKAVLRYQLIFRHLLALKHIELSLGSVWIDHVKLAVWRNRSSHVRVEMWKSRVWALRSRMLVFVQQLSYFCTNEVIEPNWTNMQSRLEQVTTVDELMREHIDFLDTCLKECMLTNSKLIRVSLLKSKLTDKDPFQIDEYLYCVCSLYS